MGRETQCQARLGRESGTGRALLEHDAVIFRGDFRARVPLAELTTVAAKAGTLRLTWPGGTLALALGEQAERWAQILRHPKSVVDKLGVRAGQKVAVLGVKDQELLADLAARLGAEPASRTSSGCDHVLLGVETPAALSKLAALREAVRPAGGIWAIYPRGRKEVAEDAIRAAAKAVGLTDVKIARISDTHGSVRLVIPKDQR